MSRLKSRISKAESKIEAKSERIIVYFLCPPVVDDALHNLLVHHDIKCRKSDLIVGLVQFGNGGELANGEIRLHYVMDKGLGKTTYYSKDGKSQQPTPFPD